MGRMRGGGRCGCVGGVHGMQVNGGCAVTVRVGGAQKVRRAVVSGLHVRARAVGLRGRREGVIRNCASGYGEARG